MIRKRHNQKEIPIPKAKSGKNNNKKQIDYEIDPNA